MTPAGAWLPPEALVADVRRGLAQAPRETAEDRFEAWAWAALLAQDGPRLLTRQGTPSHVTASAVVLSPDARSTCLVLHGRVKLWLQPGGHLEPGDLSLPAAGAREVREETGLSGRILAEPVQLSRHPAPCRVPGADWHLDVQHVLVSPPEPPVLSAESLAVAWFPVDALPDEVAPGVATLVDRAVARLRALGG